jgi:hypothetical protein
VAQTLNTPEPTTAKPGRGRKPNGQAAGLGHNSEPLTEEEHEAIQLHHDLKVQAQLKKADVAKAAYDLERTEANALVAKACAELNVPKVEYRAYLAEKTLSTTEYLKKATIRALLRKRGGMPDVNGQYSLDLPSASDTIDDKQAAYALGLRAGKNADDPEVPEAISPLFRADFEQGYADGQKDNVLKLKVAARASWPERTAAKPVQEPAAEQPENPLPTASPKPPSTTRRAS